MAEVLTAAEVERLNHMCKAAGDANLGNLLKEILEAIEDLDTRVELLESTA